MTVQIGKRYPEMKKSSILHSSLTIEAISFAHSSVAAIPWPVNILHREYNLRPYVHTPGLNALWVAQLRRDDPQMKATEIAKIVGISRERVSKILTKSGLPTRVARRTCRVCFSVVPYGNRSGICRNCHTIKLVTLVCTRCGRQFLREASQVRPNQLSAFRHKPQEVYFCNRKCHGRYTAAHYGLGLHPGGHSPRKHNYDDIWKKHIETGFGAYRLNKLLGIPRGTISVILAVKRKEAQCVNNNQIHEHSM